MLILTRRPGETLFIGDQIEIVVLDLSRHQVRIGINAPRSVSVLRKELREQQKLIAKKDAGDE